MPTNIAIGFSSANDPVTAFKEAAIMAKTQSGLPRHDLTLIAVTPTYTAADAHTLTALENLRKILNPERLIGLTAPALIRMEGIENKGVLVLTISSDEIHMGIAAQHSISLLPLQDTGLKLARELASRMSTSERHGALIFCDPLALNHTQIVRGLQEGLGRAFNVAGVISPGTMFLQDHLLSDALGGLIFGGKTPFTCAIRHGWQPLGKPRIVTDSESNLIRTIDDKPAISIYREYFPEDMAGLPAGQLGDIGLLYPLGLSTMHPKEYLIKNPSAILPDGSLVCQGEITRGTQVHLMIGDKDSCRRAAHDAAVEIRDKLHGRNPKLAFIFASLARRKLFGRSAGQELNQIKEILGLACPVFGMYTYGEFGAATSTDLQTHNASILIAGLG
ncbi:MAG: FIST N-terminal domain-containing protein [Candidatus Omnitrophota bacterium]